MVFFNYALRKLNAKIVYYGPGLCGKTTNLQWIHDHFEGGQKGKMISLATEGDRTIFFDLLPLEIGTIRGMEVTLQLYTVPGQVHYNSTRQLVLRGADGVVFVADSQRTMQKSNEDSFRNLRENLLLQGIDRKGFPHVLQFNKRDLRDLLSVEEMDGQLNTHATPIFEAVATEGVGVQETLEGIVKLVMRSLRERYESVAAEGPRPAGSSSVTAGAWPVAATAPPRTSTGPAPPSRSVTGTVQPPRPAGFGSTGLHPPQPREATTSRVDPPIGAADTEDLRLEPPRPSGPPVSFASPDDEPTAVMEDVPPIDDEGRGGFAMTIDRDDHGDGFSLDDDEVSGLEPPPPQHGWTPPSSPFADMPTDVAVGAGAADHPVDENATAWPPPPGPARSADDEVPFAEAETETGIDLGSDGSWTSADRLGAEDRYVDAIHAPGPFAPSGADSDEGDSPFELGGPVSDPMPPRFVDDEPGSAYGAAAAEAEAARETPGTSFEPVLDEIGESPDDAAEPEAEAPADVPPEVPAPRTVASPSRPAVDDLVDSVLGRSHAAAGRPVVQRPAEPLKPPLAPDRRQVTIGSGDPFGAVDEPEPAPSRTEILPAMADAGMVNVQAHDNQLQLRLQGTGAIAESGQVRELDIQVPVPGAWVGHRRVTLQLRLTLIPAPEDEDAENRRDS